MNDLCNLNTTDKDGDNFADVKIVNLCIRATGCTISPLDFLFEYCQVFKSYIHSLSYALFAITKLPNNELTIIHTLSLPPLLL